MIRNQIIISKKEILTKYSNLDTKIKSVIEKLYEVDTYNQENNLTDNVNIKLFKITDDLLKNSRNNDKLKGYEDKTGVYIFMKDNIPVYIGFSGQINKTQSLYGRIVEKHFHSKEELVKKIEKIEKYLNPNVSLPNDKHQLILEYISSIIVIDCGKKEHDNISFAQTLEVILIALFNSKYNG